MARSKAPIGARRRFALRRTLAKITLTGVVTEFALPNNTIWFTEGSSNKIGELYL